jgi:hypothetical protein
MSYVPYKFEPPSSSKPFVFTTFVGPPPVSVPPATTESYCEDLIETYNASIIEKFPDFLKDSFFTTAKDCLEQKPRRIVEYQKRGFGQSTKKSFYKYRTVLATLIKNLDKEKKTPSLPDVGFIEGPMNMTLHWSKKYKKLIYILGERHNGSVTCPKKEIKNTSKIEDYLEKIFKNPIAFIDFYLEIEGFVISRGYQNEFGGQGSLDLLRNKFKDCIDTKTRNFFSACNTSRMHFFDIRQGDIKNDIPLMTQFGSIFFDVKDNIDYGLQNYDIEELRNSNFICRNPILIETFLDFFRYWDWLVKKIANFGTQEEYEKFWYEQIYNFQILRKEINLMHSDVRPYLNWFIQTKLTDYINYEDVKNVARNIMNIYDKYLLDKDKYYGKIKFKSIMLFYDEIINFSDICTININSLLTDAYLLARVFKTFQIEDPKKQRLTDEPSEPHNIIIYAGNNHAIRCREFLTHIGFKTLEKSGEGFYKYDKIINDKCIDIKKENGIETPTITQPLFNKWPSEIEDNKMTDIDSEELKIYESFDKTFNPINNYFIQKNNERLRNAEIGQIVDEIYEKLR